MIDPKKLEHLTASVRTQDALADDIGALVAKCVDVYVVSEDLADRGLADADLVAGLKPVPRTAMPALFEAHDRVWHW